jgi:putative toxin-antitoxin system antitoxin component (TIGR02293 family)
LVTPIESLYSKLPSPEALRSPVLHTATWHDKLRHMAVRESAAQATERVAPDIAELWNRAKSGRQEGHYYVALFGLRRYDALHVMEHIRRGLAYSAFERFQRNTELPFRVIAEAAEIPERTLARRKESGRLQPDESDRLARLSRVVARAIGLFESNVDDARAWLMSPVTALGGRTPLEFASTDAGAIEVEQLIGRLEHGIPT